MYRSDDDHVASSLVFEIYPDKVSQQKCMDDISKK